MEFQSDVIYDASSANMSHLFTAVEVLMKRTFFVFSLFLFLLMGSQGYSMFFFLVVNGTDMLGLLTNTSYLDTRWSWPDGFL